MSLSLEIQGKVKKVGNQIQVTDNYRKRELIVHVEDDKDSKYDDFLTVQFSQDRCDKLNNVNIGDEVKVQTNIRGKEYSDKITGELKYFNTIEGWKIEVISSAPQQKEQSTAHQPQQPEESGEDLPF